MCTLNLPLINVEANTPVSLMSLLDTYFCDREVRLIFVVKVVILHLYIHIYLYLYIY